MSDKILKTAPAGFPITLAQVKEFGFINDTSYDDMITSLIPASVIHLESRTGTVMVDQDWYVYYDLPSIKNVVDLNTLNVTAINEVTIYDRDNAATVVDSSNYRLFNNQLIFNDNFSFTSFSFRNQQAMQVDVTAGYGADSDNQPEDLQKALSMWVVHETKSGPSYSTESLNAVQQGYDSLIYKYISWVGRI